MTMKNADLPAFQDSFIANKEGNYEPFHGLTKREYAAIEFMKAFIANKNMTTYDAVRNKEGLLSDCIDAAVASADELFKAL